MNQLKIRNCGGIIIIDVDDPSNFTLIDTTYLDYFADEYFKHLGNLTLSVYKRLINLTQKQMAGRVADTLIYLSYDIFNSSSFEIPFSRYDLW